MVSKYDRLAHMLYAALREDPFYHRLEAAYSDRDGSQEAMLRYFTLSMQEAERWGRFVYSVEARSGAALWLLPQNAGDRARKAADKREALEHAMGTACADCYAQIAANMAKHETALGLGDYWYLSILGVDPASQGEGIGAELLVDTLAEADAAGVSSYLTTFTPRNIRFYERMGYTSAGTFAEGVTSHDFHVLVRAPKANGPG